MFFPAGTKCASTIRVVVQFQSLDCLLLCGLCGPFFASFAVKGLKRKVRKDITKAETQPSDKLKLHH
jgi:hypothetical protein